MTTVSESTQRVSVGIAEHLKKSATMQSLARNDQFTDSKMEGNVLQFLRVEKLVTSSAVKKPRTLHH